MTAYMLKQEDATINLERRWFIRRSAVLGCMVFSGPFFLFEDRHSPGVRAEWRFNEGQGARTLEVESKLLDVIESRADTPEWASGVSGKCLRFDGYSTSVSHPGSFAPRFTDALTLEAWIAIDSYPVSDAAIVNQHSYPSAGYFFGLNKYGFWGLSFAVRNESRWFECWAPEPLPKGTWLHLAATFDNPNGVVLYLNGRKVHALKVHMPAVLFAEDADLLIGRHNQSPVVDDIFASGMLNGSLDELRIYDRALTEPEVGERFRSARAPGLADLRVPPDRFQNDEHRPQYHPLPPAAWTNEPHGLIFWKGEYHLFYQKNSNGPYWAQIQWGHMASRDLVHWTHLTVALVPEPGVDQAGCWSGSTTINHGVPTIVYTASDGAKATICNATSDDDMRSWKKYPGNPVIASPPMDLRLKEFRDPFVWSQGGAFYMIIGSGVNDVGGTALLYKSRDLVHWQFLKPLLVGDKKSSGVFWEMPVFGKLGDKHILLVTEVPARGSYWIGTWKDETFIPDDVAPKRLELINHYLSPSLRADERGRLIAIGIIPETRNRQELFSAGWAHVYGLPRVLSLSSDGKLRQEPLPELEQLRIGHQRFEQVRITPETPHVFPGVEGRSLEIIAQFTKPTAQRFGIALYRSPDAVEETRIYFEPFQQLLSIDRTRSSLNPAVKRDVQGGRVELESNEPLIFHIFLDHSVVEVFLNGRVTFTSRIYPTRHDSRGFNIFAEGGDVRLESLDVWRLRSIWE